MAKKRKGKILLGRKYYNKTEFNKKWSEITKKQTRQLDEFDVEFIRASLLKIPRYQKITKEAGTQLKIGQKKFQKFGVRGLILISERGSEIWVGKKKVSDELFKTKSRGTSQKALLNQAFRQLVAEDVKKERLKQMRISFSETGHLCPLSGVELSECEDGVELDHQYPFSKMVIDFYRKYRLSPEKIEVTKIGTHVIIKEVNIRELWIDYHNTHADLKLTCRKANRKKSDKIL